MTTKPDAEPGAGEDSLESSKRSRTVPPPNNGEPESQPKPLDDMPVAPLTEPADTNGG
jgi:hypothetical protein